MDNTPHAIGRRAFVSAGLGAAAATLAPRRLEAAGPTDTERANMQVVKDFCAAWPSHHDLDRIVAFFADNGSYRMTETMEPTKGRDALIARIKLIVNNVSQFRDPRYVGTRSDGGQRRIDRFANFQLKSWHGVGAFPDQGRRISSSGTTTRSIGASLTFGVRRAPAITNCCRKCGRAVPARYASAPDTSQRDVRVTSQL